MVKIENKKECSGCAACFNACPANAILMKQDNEGFLYPVVNCDKCIECGVCEKVCPYITGTEPESDMQKCYAAYNKNIEQRGISSSGGIFVLLANYILQNDGVVYGAAYDKSFTVYHKSVNSKEELPSLIGSKYMQSRIGSIYRDVKKDLHAGRQVLFVGSACQIGGLKGFLGKKYEKLTTVDFICLGVPSPKVWLDYLDTYFDRNKITYVNFKDKSLGWHTFSLRINEEKSFVKNGRKTYFFSGYFKQLYSRPSCSQCLYKPGNRISDITISDCWGAGQIAPEMDDNKGLSSVVCHTLQGEKAFKAITSFLEWKEADICDVMKYNNNYCVSAPMGEKREQFWRDYEKIPKDKLFKKYCRTEKGFFVLSILRRVVSKVKSFRR